MHCHLLSERRLGYYCLHFTGMFLEWLASLGYSHSTVYEYMEVINSILNFWQFLNALKCANLLVRLYLWPPGLISTHLYFQLFGHMVLIAYSRKLSWVQSWHSSLSNWDGTLKKTTKAILGRKMSVTNLVIRSCAKPI